MRSLRKSLKSDKPDRRLGSSLHLRMLLFNNTLSALFTALLIAGLQTQLQAQQLPRDTPKKIVRAIADYAAQTPEELSFKQGDFFWVVGRENDAHFYEVHNPAADVKGLVPVAAFEVVSNRRRPDSVQHNNLFIILNLHIDSSASSPGASPALLLAPTFGSPIGGGSGGSSGVLYGVVMYDFEARPDSDELDVSKGEYLILCAHHEFEWFIAKPINRLGGPGLVPVAYVKTLNLATKEYGVGDVADQITAAGLPTVAQWKSRAARYKAASILLEELQQDHIHMAGKTLYESEDCERVADVKIDNVYYNRPEENSAQSRLWYHVVARLLSHRIRLLARYHEDLEELHVRLLHVFPGLMSQFPPIPNSLASVGARLESWNRYLETVVAGLPDAVAASEPVAEFFALKEGDKEFDENAELIGLPIVPGFNEDGRERVTAPVVQPSARSSADTHELQLSYQMGQLGLKTSLILTNATLSLDGGVLAGVEEAKEKPALKVLTHQVETGNQLGVSLTIASAVTPASSGGPRNIKIKLYYEDDIYAVSVPPNTVLSELREKVGSRIGMAGEHIKLFVRGNPAGFNEDDDLSREIDLDEFLGALMKRDPKLKLIVIANE